MLFFIELGSRRVHLAGCTTNPTGVWVTRQARTLSFTGLFERMHTASSNLAGPGFDPWRACCSEDRRGPKRSGIWVLQELEQENPNLRLISQ